MSKVLQSPYPHLDSLRVITKRMMRRRPTPKKLRRGVVFPLMVWPVIHGAAMKKPRVIRARHTF